MKTFLRNHLGQMFSIDFFTVPTITFKALFGFIVLEHSRREVLHINVTDHPTASWTSQQIVEAFAEQKTPCYLVRDPDGVYGTDVRSRIAPLQIEEILTAPRNPWQNPYAERLMARSAEMSGPLIILNVRHLKRILASYLVITTGRGLASGWTSNAGFPGRSRVPGGSFKPRDLEGYTTATNVSLYERLGMDGVMPNDRSET